MSSYIYIKENHNVEDRMKKKNSIILKKIMKDIYRGMVYVSERIKKMKGIK